MEKRCKIGIELYNKYAKVHQEALERRDEKETEWKVRSAEWDFHDHIKQCPECGI